MTAREPAEAARLPGDDHTARRELLQILPAGLLLGVTLLANFELWEIATATAVLAAAGVCYVVSGALLFGLKVILGKFFARHGVSARLRALCAEGAFIGLIVVFLLAQLVEFLPTADRGAALPIVVAGLAAWVVFVAVLVGGAAVAARLQRRRRLHRNAPRAGT